MIAKYLTYECKKKVTSVPVVTCSSVSGNEEGRELVVAAPGPGNFKLKFSFLTAGLNITDQRVDILSCHFPPNL